MSITALETIQAMQSFNIGYREGEKNYCPGCNGTHWHVGRSMAECAQCETALPLIHNIQSSARIVEIGKKPQVLA